jgi:hypothetical protein
MAVQLLPVTEGPPSRVAALAFVPPHEPLRRSGWFITRRITPVSKPANTPRWNDCSK